MQSAEDFVLLEARTMIYSFLSTSYLNQPTFEQIATIVRHKLFDDFPLEIDDNNFKKGITLLRSWAKNIENKLDIALQDLLQDYMILFVGPGHLLAPPWESVYLTEEKLTFGPPTMEVRAFYERHGLKYHRKNLEPDDHFGLEMEFMAKLIEKQKQASTDKNQEKILQQEQIFFLQNHVLKWLYLFTDDILKNSKTDYFKGLALVTKSFIEWDYEYLKNIEQNN